MINQYHVVSEDGKSWAVFIDQSKAKEWIELANSGYCGRIGWKGEEFHLEIAEREHETMEMWYF